MEKSCGNCRFCIAAKSMRGNAELYCERRNKWIGNTILCSEWETVIVPKPLTNADSIRSMSDEELAEYFPTHASLCPDLEENKMVCKGANFMANDKMCRQCWLDWLRQEVRNGRV